MHGVTFNPQCTMHPSPCEMQLLLLLLLAMRPWPGLLNTLDHVQLVHESIRLQTLQQYERHQDRQHLRARHHKIDANRTITVLCSRQGDLFIDTLIVFSSFLFDCLVY
jgi:hypothetical protein